MVKANGFHDDVCHPVGNSLAGDDFRVWVSQQVKNRNDRVAEKNDLMIELDPEIAAAFGESANISSKFSSSKRIIL